MLIKGYSQMQSGDVFCKKGVLKNFAKFTGKHQVPEFFLNKVAGLSLKVYSKETLTQIFSCEFCEIFGTRILQSCFCIGCYTKGYSRDFAKTPGKHLG